MVRTFGRPQGGSFKPRPGGDNLEYVVRPHNSTPESIERATQLYQELDAARVRKLREASQAQYRYQQFE